MSSTSACRIMNRMLHTSTSVCEPKLIAKEGQTIGQARNAFAQRKDGGVPADLGVVQQDRQRTRTARLQTSRHLARVHGMTIPIEVTGDKHHRGIGNAGLYPVIG